MPSIFHARDADAYERVMGRWSRLLAGPFLDIASPPAGARVLEVGCGTGSLTFELARRVGIETLDALDISEAYVEHARATNADPRVRFWCSDASSLAFEDERFDAAISLLALHQMSEPERALSEMARVVRPGGTISAAVWDVRGGFPHARLFLDTAAALDPAAVAVRDAYMRAPLTGSGEMADAFRAAGLRDVAQTTISIRFTFADFEDYWAPFLSGEGIMGRYVETLAPNEREGLGAAVRAAFQAGRPEAPISFVSSAWVCTGRVGDSR